MPMASIESYYEKVPAKIAQQKLIMAEAVMTAFSKDASKIMKNWERLAYGEAAKPKPASAGELKLLGIGVKHVGKTKSG